MFLFKGHTPLIFAAENGHLGIVKLLLTEGDDVNAKDNEGKFLILYPLLYCVK